MPRLRSYLNRRVSSDKTDVGIGQIVCFAAAVGIFACVAKLTQFATTRFEVLVIVLMTLTLSVAFVILGLLLNRHRPRSTLANWTG
ncbi:MAG TPA: hypothetical protein VG326_13040 [Tepidisphaeraceae bacterium]|jgi:hypothetical protein|nr:hypothetical protein [Tepidisphaeraceae bacterium]